MRTLNVNKKAFTLAEVLVASLIAGICLAGAMTAISSNVILTTQSEEMSRAVFLAQEVREWSMNISYASISTMAATDVTPRDSMGSALTGYSGWNETITVTYLDPATLATSGTTTTMARVAVTLGLGGQTVFSTSWLVADFTEGT